MGNGKQYEYIHTHNTLQKQFNFHSQNKGIYAAILQSPRDDVPTDVEYSVMGWGKIYNELNFTRVYIRIVSAT